MFNGPGTYDVDRILADWYAPLEVEGGGEPGLKPYPVLRQHAFVDQPHDPSGAHATI